jgi:hypothetical protein
MANSTNPRCPPAFKMRPKTYLTCVCKTSPKNSCFYCYFSVSQDHIFPRCFINMEVSHVGT